MIVVGACYPIETRWLRSADGIHVIPVPVGARAAEGLGPYTADLSIGLLVSAGFSGAVTEELRTGDIVVARTIEHRGTTIRIEERLVECIEAALNGRRRRWTSGGFICVDDVVRRPTDKAALGRDGAIAVDMESGPLGRWAAAHNVPFVSVRGILDPLDCTVPFAADAPLWHGAMLHPLHAMRLGRRAVVAGRALGAALGDTLATLAEADR
jgi:hypothetical protein